MSQIKSLSLRGFKTIKELQELEFEKVNIFIGANGSGKSNIVSFFEMISFMMRDAFSNYVSSNGFASSMLYHGQKVTRDIEADIKFHSDTGESDYRFRVSHTVGDNFLFMEETILYHKKGHETSYELPLSDGGYRETKLKDLYHTNQTVRYTKDLLSNIRVFHFHDTSKTAYIRQARPLESNSELMSDGGNLAPFLYRLSENQPKYYDRIISFIKMVAPFFDNFILKPYGDSIQLKFKELNSDLELGSFRLSDGTIRFICLATLLLQPKKTLPKIIIIDEPELGLHPVAIDILAEMLNIASTNAQIFITTQSERFINSFEPKNIIVIDRKKDENSRYYSSFQKLNRENLSEWLEEYKISDMWNSNIIGGRP